MLQPKPFMSSLRPLLVNTADSGGGAARAAYRLHQGLRSIGVQSRMMVAYKSTPDNTVSEIHGAFGQWFRKYGHRFDRLPNRLYPARNRRLPWSLNWLPYPTARLINSANADAVHLHWVGRGFIPVTGLARLSKPIIWTFHDSWAFTGGCHLPLDCFRYRDKCGACPQLN